MVDFVECCVFVDGVDIEVFEVVFDVVVWCC